MREFLYLSKDIDIHLIGESERLVIPGNLTEILEWMQTNPAGIISRYERYFLPTGEVIYFDRLDNKRPAFAFHKFEHGINNRVTISLIYDQKAKYDAYSVLYEMGVTAGAEWTQRVREILEIIPPPGYYDKPETREISPGVIATFGGIWREGPPPGWKPPTHQPGQAETAQEMTAEKYDELCKKWVNRPSVPYMNKSEFLSENAPELLSKSFDRILLEAYSRGVIDRTPGKHGRYKPKI